MSRRHSSRTHWTLVCAWLMLASMMACSHAPNPAGPAPIQNLPRQFRLTASASGGDGTSTATCNLDWTFELRNETARTPQRVDYKGIHGGEAARTVLEKDQSGFSFLIEVFGDVEAHLTTRTGEVQIRIPINETAGSRFYRELARLDGIVDAEGLGSGAWACAPLDLDQGGYLDKTLTVSGTWRIQPTDR